MRIDTVERNSALAVCIQVWRLVIVIASVPKN